jgi:5-methylcytosine-specific restriction endonuclease McrA
MRTYSLALRLRRDLAERSRYAYQRAEYWEVERERVDYWEVLLNQSATCYICGNEVTRHTLHFDHVIPLSVGGPHLEWNIRVCCEACNMRKGPRQLDIA